jgi:hypothetical protein
MSLKRQAAGSPEVKAGDGSSRRKVPGPHALRNQLCRADKIFSSEWTIR